MKVWLIYCCTNISDDNEVRHYDHYRGPYNCKELAEKKKVMWMSNKNNPIGNWSNIGEFTIQEVEAEMITNDRYIINDSVFYLQRNPILTSMNVQDYLTHEFFNE